MRYRVHIWIIGVFIVLGIRINLYADSGEDLFRKARSKTISRKWDSAIRLYEQFIHEYPDHSNQDDTFFWLAYCTEKKSGGGVQAFLRFEELIKAFPNSAWKDDAMIHQIGIAARLVKDGYGQYLDFIRDLLAEPDPNVRNHAAVTLGMLGDPSALPVLSDLRESHEYGRLSQPLIRDMETQSAASASRAVKTAATGSPMPSLSLKEAPNEMGEELEPGWRWERFLPTHYSLRYVQYRSLLKTSSDWSDQELENYAMWLILPTDGFEELRHLAGYDRTEWLRKYWKKMDPLPTTVRNEAYEAFRERVQYAYAHFSGTWDHYRKLTYLQDQYQHSGWPNAPFDARGELWVKYGAPDSRDPGGWHAEVWHYRRYHADFIVQKWITNFYGEGYKAGPVTRSFFQNKKMLTGSPGYIEEKVVANTEFHFELKADVKELKKLECRFHPTAQGVKVDYTLPVRELNYVEANGALQFDYDRIVVVFNEDYREVYRDSTAASFVRADQSAIKTKGKESGRFRIEVPPDAFKMVVRFQDRHSNRMKVVVEDVQK